MRGVDKLAHLCADTITGSHDPLWFGWSELQINTVADYLGLPQKNRRCIAAVVCSLVAAYLSDGVGELRYSRSKRQYARYPDPDPLMVYRQVRPAADYLLERGWAAGKMGGRCERKQSIIWATPELIDLVGDLVDISGRAVPSVDAIVLRDAAKKPMAVVDTDEILAMRDEMTEINTALRAAEVYLDGHRVHVPCVSRIFNQTLLRCGRLYGQGRSWQNMPKDQRDMLTMMVDGEMVSTVERDYSTLHPRLVYAAAGKRMPDGGAYEIANFERGLVKVAFNILLNANSRNAAIGAIAKTLHDDPDLRRKCGLSAGDGGSLRQIAHQVVAAIEHKHYRIEDCFGSDCGARFQRVDSDICVRVLLAMIKRTGRCPLPVHDSFIVPVGDEQALEEEMDRALSEAYSALLPTSRNRTSPPFPPFHLGNQVFDLQEPGTQKDVQILVKETAAMTLGQGITTRSHGPPPTSWTHAIGHLGGRDGPPYPLQSISTPWEATSYG